MITKNLGDLERTLRVVGGLAGLATLRYAPRPVQFPLGLMAVSTVLSGVTGWCPTYAAIEQFRNSEPKGSPHRG